MADPTTPNVAPTPAAGPAPARRRGGQRANWLSELPAGRSARLDRPRLEPTEVSLLAAMGLAEGCRFVVRAAGDPCIIEVRNTRIGLARAVADRLLVSTDEAEPETGSA